MVASLWVPDPAAAMASTWTTVPVTAVCPQDPAPNTVTCFALRRTDVTPRTGQLAPATAAAPIGYGPAELDSAYDISTKLEGGTVAIVDVYDDPDAESDLAAYRARYDLPACTTANGCLRKVNQNGDPNDLPAADTSGWATEIALDTDMVSAACPLCHILLVEADSTANADIGAAENYAASVPGVRVVSNSFGGSETAQDPSVGQEYFDHPNVAVVAAAGDDGYGVEFPAASPYVIAVGGTTLSKADNTRGWTESVWSTSADEGTGSGCSADETKPAWQTDTGCADRAVADLSADADPATGVAVYDSYGSGGWTEIGGTSAAAPLVAAMYAEADNANPSAAYAYANPSGLNDVTTGQNCDENSVSYLCQAQVGYDGPTGNGTPNGLLALGGPGAATPPTLGGTATPSCPTGKRLVDAGFESRSTGWIASRKVIGKHTGNGAPHSGSWSAELDGTGHTHTDTLAQTVAVPAPCNEATVSFWLKITTKETTKSTAHDKLTVTLGSTKLATYSNIDHAGYKHLTLRAVLPTGTTTATLKFTGTENNSKATWFTIDDTSLTLA
jgi:hypothetical protein